MTDQDNLIDNKSSNNIKVTDLLMLLKAIEAADKRGIYSTLEIETFKPSFDAVHAFLVEYQKTLEKAQQDTSNVMVTETSNTVSKPKKATKTKKETK